MPFTFAEKVLAKASGRDVVPGEIVIVEPDLLLSHDNKVDPCEAYPTEDHTFNLIPLKNEFIKTFSKDSGSILLILKENEAVYNF